LGSSSDLLREARDFLVGSRLDYQRAVGAFQWPRLERFNFATDWLDHIAERNDRDALRVIFDDGAVEARTYSDLSAASRRIARFLASLGVGKGDRVLLMLGNVPALWEVMVAAMRMGAVMVPTAPLLSQQDLADRIRRGKVRCVIADVAFVDKFGGDQAAWTGVTVGGAAPGWRGLEEADGFSSDPIGVETRADDPLLLYFTSGTTASPKLVLHTHASYPIGHLSTMYWLGLRPGDLHLNISSPGWAKHAWSCVFAPWLAEATAVVLNQPRFDPVFTLDMLVRERITSFCAPPTVWRMLIQQPLKDWPVSLRELVAAGEPLNAEVIRQVQAAWGLEIRDGFGQTETSALIANTPGQPIKIGSMGRPLPGFEVVLLDDNGDETTEGEVSLRLGPHRPVGLMAGYSVDDDVEGLGGDVYRTGDVATRDADGYFTYVGRADDVFKSSDYRISPFELESVLIQHPDVTEAAVVPSPHPTRLSVPKGFITLAPGVAPSAEVARSIFQHSREILGPFKRIRRLEVLELPKTISGKIRRVELKELERQRRLEEARGAFEWLEDEVI
jgi:acetyl-CoA synthetase